MIFDTSYGVIPLRKIDDVWSILLVRQRANYWSFPKGHPEHDETALESAKRELQEETGLTVTNLLADEPVKENYIFLQNGKEINKTVYYFLATVDGILKVQEEEILEAKWVALENAAQLVTFSEGKALCKQVVDILSMFK